MRRLAAAFAAFALLIAGALPALACAPHACCAKKAEGQTAVKTAPCCAPALPQAELHAVAATPAPQFVARPAVVSVVALPCLVQRQAIPASVLSQAPPSLGPPLRLRI